MSLGERDHFLGDVYAEDMPPGTYRVRSAQGRWTRPAGNVQDCLSWLKVQATDRLIGCVTPEIYGYL